MRLQVILLVLAITSVNVSSAQNAYVKLGQQALMEGDFKVAIQRLEKACVIDSTNADALWMLGYSYYHSDNYRKSVAAYTRAIAVKPTDASSYYYRARGKSYLGKDAGLAPAERERYMMGAILDYTKAINLGSKEDKYYQNRGLAYCAYATFKLEPNSRSFDKSRGLGALKASIADYEKILADDPSRSDINTLLDASKQKLAAALASH